MIYVWVWQESDFNVRLSTRLDWERIQAPDFYLSDNTEEKTLLVYGKLLTTENLGVPVVIDAINGTAILGVVGEDVSHVSGGNVQWNVPVNMEQNIAISSNQNDYVLKNVPYYLLNVPYVGSDVTPSGESWKLEIYVNPNAGMNLSKILIRIKTMFLRKFRDEGLEERKR